MTAEWSVGQLARAGLSDLDSARRMLAEPAVDALASRGGELDLLADLSHAADPDQALRLLARVLDACPPQLHARVLSTVAAEPDVSRRLIDVLGMSEALGEFLVRHPSTWQILADGELIAQAPGARAVREYLLRAVGADPQLPEPVATSDDIEILDAACHVFFCGHHLLALSKMSGW